MDDQVDSEFTHCDYSAAAVHALAYARPLPTRITWHARGSDLHGEVIRCHELLSKSAHLTDIVYIDKENLIYEDNERNTIDRLLAPSGIKRIYYPTINIPPSYERDIETYFERIARIVAERDNPIYLYVGKYQDIYEKYLLQYCPASRLAAIDYLKETAPPFPVPTFITILDVMKSQGFNNRFVHYDLGVNQSNFTEIFTESSIWNPESDPTKEELEAAQLGKLSLVKRQNSNLPEKERSIFDRDIAKRVEGELIKIALQYKLSGSGQITKGSKAAQNLASGRFDLADLDRLVALGDKPLPKSGGTPNSNALRHFVNHSLRPHLDYFIGAALMLNGHTDPVDWSQFPALAEAGGYAVDPEKVRSVAANYAKQAAVTPPAAFAELLDVSKGDHFTRLQRALDEVDGKMGEFGTIYRSLTASINEAVANIDQKEAERLVLAAKKERGIQSNAYLESRAEEMLLMAEARLSVAQKQNDILTDLNAFQIGAYGMAKATKGIPILHGLFEFISESSGGHHAVQNRTTARTNLAAAEVEAEARTEVSRMMRRQMVNIDSIERETETINQAIKKLQNDGRMKAIAKDENKQRAIADAFVNKSVLDFGMRMSTAIRDACDDHNAGSIDSFLAHFQKAKPRLGEALQNLAFGFADSNDLSVLLAEAACLKGKQQPQETVLKDFVETIVKPNIAALYSHGSKVDIIYQANLSGLGSPFNAARVMIRSAHDQRVGALFADAFGVESELGQLTIRGAVDVKNIFDFYMHRHGDRTLTDAKVRDGVFTGEHVRKRVSAIPADAMSAHVEMAKTARGFRQSAPDISDMFLRICGYEYFYPQAFNAAQTSNIMLGNPEAPAAYVMANAVIHDFIERLSFTSIDGYREKVGERLDNLVAQTFMDFFAELGNRHSADPALGMKRAELKTATTEANSYGFAFDSYTKRITKDATSQFDLFLALYKRNLEKQLETATEQDAKVLEQQIDAVDEMTKGALNPEVIRPGTQQALSRAHLTNHLYENTLTGSRPPQTAR